MAGKRQSKQEPLNPTFSFGKVWFDSAPWIIRETVDDPLQVHSCNNKHPANSFGELYVS